MVSELLQDRPRLVKQMGSIIFILVYKWIFQFPLGYLNYHQRSTVLQSPSSLNHGSFCPRKLLRFLLMAFCWCCWFAVAKPSQTSARMAQCCVPLKSCCCRRPPGRSLSRTGPAAPQSSVQCWKGSGGSSGVRATGLLQLHPLTSPPSAGLVPVINSWSRKDLNSWSSTQGLSGWWRWLARAITEGEREMGHFRKDMHLKTCPCWRNA